MSNPPTINFAIPFSPVAFHVVVNSNGVQPDGTNVPIPDTTSVLTFFTVQGAAAFTASVDPGDNRRVIVTPGLLAVGVGTVAWSFRISVAGKLGTVTVSGNTPIPSDASGVTWDGVPVGPA